MPTVLPIYRDAPGKVFDSVVKAAAQAPPTFRAADLIRIMGMTKKTSVTPQINSMLRIGFIEVCGFKRYKLTQKGKDYANTLVSV